MAATKKKPEAQRAAAADEIATYVVAVLERQLDAGADRRFKTGDDFADLVCAMVGKIHDLRFIATVWVSSCRTRPSATGTIASSRRSLA